MLNKYIVTVQELHEKRYLVSNAVAPQQAQEWLEIHMDGDLSDLLQKNIQDMDGDTRFITDGKNNIAENLRDIHIKKVADKDLPYHLSLIFILLLLPYILSVKQLYDKLSK